LKIHKELQLLRCGGQSANVSPLRAKSVHVATQS